MLAVKICSKTLILTWIRLYIIFVFIPGLLLFKCLVLILFSIHSDWKVQDIFYHVQNLIWKQKYYTFSNNQTKMYCAFNRKEKVSQNKGQTLHTPFPHSCNAFTKEEQNLQVIFFVRSSKYNLEYTLGRFICTSPSLL